MTAVSEKLKVLGCYVLLAWHNFPPAWQQFLLSGNCPLPLITDTVGCHLGTFPLAVPLAQQVPDFAKADLGRLARCCISV